jgi:hypothetical protein
MASLTGETKKDEKIKALIICSDDNKKKEGETLEREARHSFHDFNRIEDILSKNILEYFGEGENNIKWSFLSGGGHVAKSSFPQHLDDNDKYNIFVFTGCNFMSWLLPSDEENRNTGIQEKFDEIAKKFTNNLVKYKSKNPIIVFVENLRFSERRLEKVYKLYDGNRHVVPIKLGNDYVTLPWQYLYVNDLMFNTVAHGSDKKEWKEKFEKIFKKFDEIPNEEGMWYYKKIEEKEPDGGKTDEGGATKKKKKRKSRRKKTKKKKKRKKKERVEGRGRVGRKEIKLLLTDLKRC